MRLIALFLAFLAFVPACVQAKTVPESTSQTAVSMDRVQVAPAWGRGTDGRDHMIRVNPDGSLAIGSFGIAMVPLAVSVSALVYGSTHLTNVTGTWDNVTVTTYNLTSTAGYNGPIEAWVNAAQGGAVVKYWFHPSVATAPSAALLGVYGSYLATSSTTQIPGRWVPGTHLSIVSYSSTAVDGTLTLVK